MRYFMFSYMVDGGVGNVVFKSEKFPSQVQLLRELDVDVLTGWYEFKSKEDYDNFKEGS